MLHLFIMKIANLQTKKILSSLRHFNIRRFVIKPANYILPFFIYAGFNILFIVPRYGYTFAIVSAFFLIFSLVFLNYVKEGFLALFFLRFTLDFWN